MKRDLVITLNLTRLLNKRRVVAALLVGSTALVCAAVPIVFKAGDALSAQQLDDNFDAVVDKTSDETVAGKKTWTSDAAFGSNVLVDGSVGIGTTSPGDTLDVSGTVRLAGIQLFQKPGYNGTVSCDTFCQGTQWGQIGSCFGGKTGSGAYVNCAAVPQLDVQCICASIP
jgi:hypothetical protein